MPFSIIPFVLLVVPIAEIAAFILIGQQIGLLPTLAMILVTAIIGSILLRVQGFGLLNRIREETEAGRLPGRQLVHGVMILIAGVLLLTPGFITDGLGFLLFVPAVRDAAWRLLQKRIVIVASSRGGFRSGPGGARSPDGSGRGRRPDGAPVIDLEEEEFRRDPDPDSPWRDGDGRS